jgi:4-hydroxy-tetrahydrodipicolinate synthase
VIARAQRALDLGIDAIVVTTPFGAGIAQTVVYAHYQAIRQQVPIPLFLYNEEAISGNAIAFETLVEICKLEGVVGIKESSGSPEFTNRLVRARLGVPVFQGWENHLLATRGVDGYVAPLANIEPELLTDMLKSPSLEKQTQIDVACEKYGLLRDDWYVALKAELQRRGTLSTARVL